MSTLNDIDGDAARAALLLGAMTCLLLVLKNSGIVSPWAMIPFRIASQRTVAASCLFTVLFNMAIDTHIYYLPTYFQAVHGTTAEQSGIRMLPYLRSNILATIVPDTAVQIVLPTEDAPIGNSSPVFSQALGGALAISIAQNILTNTLSQELKMIPGLDSSGIIALGAKNLTSTVPTEHLNGVPGAHTYALSRTLILPIAAAGMAFVCSLGMEWRKVERKIEM
ncbi:hypothetical protein BOTNAR_0025g00510 [Botryotinia narcissicola]|uniref:Major facilitator superfamily (MFS) profile domain-containing protein n=1 Tax=Botryotinia narcissicola TaxID=278944 RepID=A0A4Z1J3X9_9HELO|nr:hypothetical protein BOTNAR_0025g00510 [Botryotinia narcissicola]